MTISTARPPKAAGPQAEVVSAKRRAQRKVTPANNRPNVPDSIIGWMLPTDSWMEIVRQMKTSP